MGPLTFNYSYNPEWNSSGFLFMETISGVTLSTNPQITFTPQETMEDSEFNPINLLQIVSDPDDDPTQIVWSFSGNEININAERSSKYFNKNSSIKDKEKKTFSVIQSR